MKKSGRPGARSAPVKTILSAPAVQALLYQFLAFLLILLIDVGMGYLVGLSLSILFAALGQGLIAAGISRLRGLAPWWLIIQFIFPPALILVLYLQLPPILFLVAFVILVALYWSTFRTQVPYYPSRQSTWQAVEKLLPSASGGRFIDIGSGLGGLTLNLAARRPDMAFTGIEIAPLPWLVSASRCLLSRSRARFQLGDYDRLNFADYDLVFAYLSPAAMPALWEKAKAEMRSGALLISYEFPVEGVIPTSVISPVGSRADLHIWRMP